MTQGPELADRLPNRGRWHALNCRTAEQFLRTPLFHSNFGWNAFAGGAEGFGHRQEVLLQLPPGWVVTRNGSFRKLGVPYFGILTIRILLVRVRY